MNISIAMYSNRYELAIIDEIAVCLMEMFRQLFLQIPWGDGHCVNELHRQTDLSL